MNATKLAVAGFFALTLMFAANAQTASAAPFRRPVVHYGYRGVYWGHRPVYSVAPVYSYAPVATTCVAEETVVPAAPVAAVAPVETVAPVATVAPVVTATVPVPACTTGVYFGVHHGRFYRHWR